MITRNIDNNGIKIINKINKNTEYEIVDIQTQESLETRRGDELIQENIVTWYDYFKNRQQALLPGRSYQVLKIISTPPFRIPVFQRNIGTLQITKDDKGNIAPLVNSNSGVKHLSDAITYQNSLTFNTLQDELVRKDNYVISLQDNLNEVYEQLGKKDSEYFVKIKELQDEILKLRTENEALKRQSDMEKFKLDLERKQFEFEKEQEKKYIKREKELEDNNSFGLNDILQNLPHISNLVSAFGGKPAMPVSAFNPSMLQNIIEQNKNNSIISNNNNDSDNNINYPEVEII